MIRYQFCSALSGDDAAQLAGLLVRAAAYDAEPEYNAIDPDDVERDMGVGGGVRDLVIWLTDRSAAGLSDECERVAGLIRLVPTHDGWADGTVVIDPDFRSIGILTLLLEQEGVDPSTSDGWLGSGFAGIRGWARGNHPASGRIGDRNLLPRTQRIWKLVRPSDAGPCESSAGDTGSAVALTAADADVLRALVPSLNATDTDRAHLDAGVSGASERATFGVRGHDGLHGVLDLDLAPIHVDEIGRCASVGYIGTAPALGDVRRAVLADLIVSAGARAAADGLDGLIIYASSVDDDLVAAARQVGCQHDRTDTLYEIR